MSDFLAALKNEIAEIEVELRGDPRFCKWEQLQSVLLLYQSNGVSEPRMVDLSPRAVARTPSEHRLKALELARLFLRNRSGPTPTRDIYDHIINNGGEIGGKDPVSNLSAMLSNSGDFQSNGRAGWTLPPENGQEPIPESSYKDISESVIIKFSDEELKDTFSWVATNRKIPGDIDSRLLGEAREKIGRFLTDKETTTLRNTFTKILSDYIR